MTSDLFKAGFATALFALSGPLFAQTITVPETSVCVDNGAPSCSTSDLQAGNIYLLQSSEFQDFEGNQFDVAVEVLLRTTPDPRIITSFGQVDTGGFVQYNISFVNPITTSVGTLPPLSALTPFVSENTVFTARFEDIDSNDNGTGTFSEFVGVDTRDIGSGGLLVGDALTTATSGGSGSTEFLDDDVARALTQSDGGGFAPADKGVDFLDDLAAGVYAFAYAEKINDSWRDVPNITNRTSDGSELLDEGLPYIASFSLGSDPVDFNFIYGVANEGTSRGNTRQFALSVEAAPVLRTEPVPEIDGPVLVQVGFALGGLYMLMLGRRRREDDVEMRQAVA